MSFEASNLSFVQAGRPGESKESLKDSFNVATDWIKKGSPAAKAIYVTIEFFQNLDIFSKDSPLTTVSEHARLVKLSHSPGAFLKAINTLRNSTVKWWNSDPEGAISRIWRDFLGLVSPVVDFTTLLHKKFVTVASRTLNVFNGTNGVALAIIRGWDAWESFEVLSCPKGACPNGAELPYTQFQYDEKFIKLVFQVSFVAIGVMTALTAFFNFTFAPLTYSIFSMTTVVFGFIDYYHKNIQTAQKKI